MSARNNKTSPLKAIRAKCMDCSCSQPKEIRLCPIEKCSLYAYRFGTNPKRTGIGGDVARFKK